MNKIYAANTQNKQCNSNKKSYMIFHIEEAPKCKRFMLDKKKTFRCVKLYSEKKIKFYFTLFLIKKIHRVMWHTHWSFVAAQNICKINELTKFSSPPKCAKKLRLIQSYLGSPKYYRSSGWGYCHFKKTLWKPHTCSAENCKQFVPAKNVVT